MQAVYWRRWVVFETTSSVGIAKKKLITLVRLIRGSKREYPSISSHDTSYDPVELRTEFMEAEAKKAQALLYWNITRRLRAQ